MDRLWHSPYDGINMLINQTHRDLGSDQKQHWEKVKPEEHYIRHGSMHLYPQNSLLIDALFLYKNGKVLTRSTPGVHQVHDSDFI